MLFYNLLHRADEPQKGRNSCPRLQPYFIGFCRVGVSQSQFFYVVSALQVLDSTKRRYNLGQNEWNISTTPPPHFNDAKMAGFGLRAPSSLLWGGRGLIVPFYSVQDCRLLKKKT